jgi:hypothetical protein
LILGNDSQRQFERVVQELERKRHAPADERAPASTAGKPPAQMQVELRPELQCVEFRWRQSELDIDSPSLLVPYVFLELSYYAMLGAKLAPVFAAVAGNRFDGGSPGPASDRRNDSAAGPSLHRDTPP